MNARPATGPGGRFRRTDLYLIPRIFVGLILLLAAALKIHQLSTVPLPGSGLLGNRWLNLLEADFEIALGFGLLSGWARRFLWAVSLACFTVFSGVTASRFLAGEESCGCFGAVEVSPLATLVLDVSIVLMLVFLRPRPGGPPTWLRWRRFAAAAIPTFVAVVATAVPVLRFSPSRLTPSGAVEGTDRAVILEPEDWVGLRLPIERHIDIAGDLTVGEWTAVLIRRGCPGCSALVPQLAARIRALGPGKTARVALIQIPPWGDPVQEARADHSLFLWGRLDDSREWFGPTPTVLWLRDGNVVDVLVAQGEDNRKKAAAAPLPVRTSGDR